MAFNQYPYTDFHELNLDWIIAKIKKLHSDWDNFKVINQIRFYGEWDINKAYPAWALVSIGNVGYISKKPVPAGMPITEIDYWAPVADYSAIIADVQQRIVQVENEVSQLRTEVESLSHPGLILISDSYGLDNTSGGKSWVSWVKEVFPNAYTAVEGGTGFGSDVYMQNNWLSMLQALNVPDHATISKIVVIGGANDANLVYDQRLSESVLTSRINSFCAWAKSNYPNAVIDVAFVGGYLDGARVDSYSRTAAIYERTVSFNSNAAYYANGESIMKDSALINASDLIHPTAEGGKELGKLAMSIINGGKYEFNRIEIITPVIHSDITGLNVPNVRCIYKGNVAVLKLLGGSSGNSGWNVNRNASNINYASLIRVATLPGAPVQPTNSPIYQTVTALESSTISSVIATNPLLMTYVDRLLEFFYMGYGAQPFSSFQINNMTIEIDLGRTSN